MRPTRISFLRSTRSQPRRLFLSRFCRFILPPFIDEFFDQNPLSQLAVVVTRDGRAELISPLSSNARTHIAKVLATLSTSRSRALPTACHSRPSRRSCAASSAPPGRSTTPSATASASPPSRTCWLYREGIFPFPFQPIAALFVHSLLSSDSYLTSHDAARCPPCLRMAAERFYLCAAASPQPLLRLNVDLLEATASMLSSRSTHSYCSCLGR